MKQHIFHISVDFFHMYSSIYISKKFNCTGFRDTSSQFLFMTEICSCKLFPTDSFQLSSLFNKGLWLQKLSSPGAYSRATRKTCIQWLIYSNVQTPIPLNTTPGNVEVPVQLPSSCIAAQILPLPTPLPFVCLPKSTLVEPNLPE